MKLLQEWKVQGLRQKVTGRLHIKIPNVLYPHNRFHETEKRSTRPLIEALSLGRMRGDLKGSLDGTHVTVKNNQIIYL